MGPGMATDIKLDQQGGNWVLIEGAVVKTTAADLMVDSAARRGGAGGPHRRALVHAAGDVLAINFAGDYTGGVTLAGDLVVSGDVRVRGGAGLGAGAAALSTDVGALSARVQQLEQTVAALLGLVGAVVIPEWLTKTEVEEGDDMGLVSPPASELGLNVEYEVDQLNPAFGHEDVVSITPPAGSVVLRGSTVRIRINLEG